MVATRRPVAAPRRRTLTGISVSTTELCAADIRLGADATWRRRLDPPAAEGGAWPSLAAALHDLAGAVGATGGLLAVALMPPLTEVRRLDLPPARTEDLQLVLSRNAGRYFVNARGAQVVGVSGVARSGDSARASVIATAAPARLVASIRAAAEESGWVIDSMAPAETAWTSAAVAAWPAFERGTAFVAIAQADRNDLLQIENRQLVGVRRFRAGTDDAPMMLEAMTSGARVGILGAPHHRAALASVLSSLGARVSTNAGDSYDAGTIAAEHASGTAGPVLKTEDTIARERTAARQATWVVTGAAVALFATAATIELWGVRHQLESVRHEREALRPKIASTLVGRSTVEAAFHDLAALSAADRAAPQWSAVIAALSTALPADAHLAAIRGHGDSVVVDGLAEHAARVFDALSGVPSLAGVKAAAPVRRELQDDGSSLEHFTIAARVRSP